LITLIWYLLSMLFYPISSGYTESLKLEERNLYNLDFDKAYQINKQWHTFKFIENISAVNLGISIAISSDKSLLDISKRTFLSAIVYWILYDLTLDLRGFNGSNSSSILNKVEYLKLPLLALGIYLFLE